MEDKTTFSECEYTALRNEIVSRIGLINSQAHTAILTIITMWGAGFTLLISGEKICSFIDMSSYELLRSIVFLIPVFYFLPLAIKNRENILQIASIAAYIKVFYEYQPHCSLNKRFEWEISNSFLIKTQKYKKLINGTKKLKGNSLKLLTSDYSILSTASVIIYLIISASTIANHIKQVNNEILFAETILFIFVYAVLSISSIMCCVYITKLSFGKDDMQKATDIFTRTYIKRAAELGIIPKDEIGAAEYYLRRTSHLR